MDPSAKHLEYTEMEPVWKRCRDASTGQRAIHAGGEDYLPKLSGQSDADYKKYLARASYFNATGRTVAGMVGLVFRKQPTVTLPKTLEQWTGDINMAGKSLEGFAREAVEEVIKVARAGVLVDFPPTIDTAKGTALTIEQARQQGLRPYLTFYKAATILNWRVGRINNVSKLINVFLEETYEDDDKIKKQIRELFLADRYYQRIWRHNDKGQWAVFEDITPQKNGQPIFDIPFFLFAPKESGPEVQDPPIEDLVNVNLAHYMNSADLENGAHVAGLPTPWVNGIDDDNAIELHLGANTFIKLPPGAEAGFLQCGNEGFATIEKAMDRKEQQMAALGARMLAPEKRDAEAEGTHEIKRGGENSVLATLAGSVERTLTQALQFMADWVGADPEQAKIELNKDYLPSPMSPQLLTAWLAQWQSGAISDLTYFEGIQQGELVSEGLTFEEEQERKEISAPSLGMVESAGKGE